MLFRFAFCYIALYAVYLVDQLLTLAVSRSASGVIVPFPASVEHAIIPWIGTHILHLSRPVTVFTNGSGDTTYDWILVLTNIAIAIGATAVWSLLDRRRASYSRLYAWLHLVVRLLLGFELLTYGFDKVIPVQFGQLTPSLLAAPFGTLSPMGVLWASMAASTGYTIFTGSVEVVAGILLFIPRLTTLGALVTLVSMSNVFALNLFYDVPVKLLSFHLLLLAIFLLLPDFPRLANLLVFNRPAAPSMMPSLATNLRIDRAVLLASWALGVVFATAVVHTKLMIYREQISAVGVLEPADVARFRLARHRITLVSEYPQ